ncbi:MAG: site-specific DNA-methyltransferase [Verrucomicrobiales bacterium]|nr:site-specific DNA-methyltransferase [Verrucomicrobiales bacterium]
MFTSPPYAGQRDYDGPAINDWTGMMCAWVIACQPFLATDVQVFVNLGQVHVAREWQPYWAPWIEWMRRQGWLRFGLNIWDQGGGLPGEWNGRLAPSWEFIFHFCRQPRAPNKWVTKDPGNVGVGQGRGLRSRDGKRPRKVSSPQASLQTHKIFDNIWRIQRQKGPVGMGLDHPAPFPVGLPAYAIHSYTAEGDLIYDPFLGSGSTLLACEQTGRGCIGAEISPSYAAVILERWNRITGNTPLCSQ